MEDTYLHMPWLHLPGWTTQGQRLCQAVASSQGLGFEVAGPAHQTVRAQRLRWWLGEENIDREVGETKKLIYCYTLYIIIEHYIIVITLYIIK